MTKPALTLADLKMQLEVVGEWFRALAEHELDIAWFLRAYVTDSEKEAAEAQTGKSNDQGVDALVIDNTAKAAPLRPG